MGLIGLIRKIIILLSVILVFQTGWLFAASEGKKVRVGIFQNKPLSFKDAQNVAQGIYPDLIREIAKLENWELEFILNSWSGCLEQLKSGNIDIMISIITTATFQFQTCGRPQAPLFYEIYTLYHSD